MLFPIRHIYDQIITCGDFSTIYKKVCKFTIIKVLWNSHIYFLRYNADNELFGYVLCLIVATKFSEKAIVCRFNATHSHL